MPSALLALLTNKWIWVGVVIAGLSLALYVTRTEKIAAQKGETAALAGKHEAEASLKTAEGVNAENLKQIAALKAETARVKDVADAALAGNTDRDKTIADLRRKTRNVPASENGPVAPVLCAALDGVRKALGATGPACNNPDPGRAR